MSISLIPDFALLVQSNLPENDTYGYMDWFLTVPLLLVETVAVLAIPEIEARPLPIKVVVAAVLMMATGLQFQIQNFPILKSLPQAMFTIFNILADR